MLIQKRFSGILNKDDKESDVLSSQHIGARNLRFTGGQNGLTAEGVPGTILINNSDLPAGKNECIGSFFDSVNQRIFWFNWNQYGTNGIYQYNLKTRVLSKVFLVGTDSATDILNFSLDYPVHSCAMVYRTTGDGDLLYWTDGYNPPRYLNVDTVAANAPFTQFMINAAKIAPNTPPNVMYLDDSTTLVNNLSNKLFRFAYRFVFKNGEKSTFSPLSKVPLPLGGFNDTILSDPTKNNRIYITGVARYPDNLSIGDINGVEIVGQESLGTAFGDYFLITKIPIPDFSSSSFSFYFKNDSTYTTISTDESDLYFSWLPDKANTLESLNGNVITYGGCTDGYDKITESQCDVVLYSGLGMGEGSVAVNIRQYSSKILYGIFIPPTLASPTVNIYITYVDGGGTHNVVVSGPYTNTAALVTAINLQLVAAGISATVTATQVGAGNTFTIQTTDINGNFTAVSFQNIQFSNVPYPNSVLKWASKYRWGLIYYDKNGKTNGVISFVDTGSIVNDFSYTASDFPTTTMSPAGNQYVPYMAASINHLPPSWATRFAWVRTPNQTTGNYIQLVTNDVKDPGDGYYYFCIQNLYYLKTQNSGFVPSYEFAKGDRLRIVSSYNPSNGERTGYSSQYDFEIVGQVELTMPSPAQPGKYLKVKKPTSPVFFYSANTFIELYTPLLRSSQESQVFYEFGETFEIDYYDGSTPNIRYHAGNVQDQSATNPATFMFYAGDSYFKPRTFYLNVLDTATKTITIMSPSYSDYFESSVNSDGRGWVIDESAKEEYNPVIVRWGGKYQSGTNINQLNIFRPNDYDEVDRSRGDIRRFRLRDRTLRVFQDRGIGRYGVYQRYIQNNEGQNELVTTNEIITTNNIQYFNGQYGLGGYATNLCSGPLADYFTDIITGRGIRLGYDGLTDLGMLYKGQYYFPTLVTPYNRPLTRSNGSRAKVMAFFDTYNGEYHTILQPSTETAGAHFSFNETRNGYCSDRYDYNPDWAICANDTIFSWKDGFFYSHTNTHFYAYFYGVSYPVELSVVFNESLVEKKSWNAISQVSNQIWAVPLLYTNVNTYPGQRQETNLVAAEFALLENMPSSAVKRDVHSPGGKVGGNFMKGNWAALTLSAQYPANFVNLSLITMRATDSPRTDK